MASLLLHKPTLGTVERTIQRQGVRSRGRVQFARRFVGEPVAIPCCNARDAVMEILLFVVFASVVIALAIFSALQAKKRREALAALAASLGLRFDPEQDSSVDERYPFLSKLNTGSNRYASNRLSGDYRGHPVELFDYHYETYSTDAKGRRQTQHHHFAYFVLHLPRRFPELTITREGVLSKLAQAFGYDDIDFESAEFSRKFCVRSRDKKLAYDLCHARMMEYLLANDDLSVEVDEHCLATFRAGHLDAAVAARDLDRLVKIRELIPDYVWTGN
jgi:hypothetical protein